MRKLAIQKGSSFIKDIQYDHINETMRVTFNSGTTWEAEGVPGSVASTLETPGTSAGKFWHSYLKTAFTWGELV